MTIISADAILYGSENPRASSARRHSNVLHHPMYLDPEVLDAPSRFEFIFDDASWIGSGNLWIARSAEEPISLLEEWSHLDLDVPEMRAANSFSAQEYLEQMQELEESEEETAYAMSRSVSFEHIPDAAKATVTVSSSGGDHEHHYLSIQRWAVVEQVAGSGGEWRYLSFYIPDARQASKAEYQQLLYFHDRELHGSVTLNC